MNETRAEFEARYPRPRPTSRTDYTRVLVICENPEEGDGAHWAWGTWYFAYTDGGLPPWETLAELIPRSQGNDVLSAIIEILEVTQPDGCKIQAEALMQNFVIGFE